MSRVDDRVSFWVSYAWAPSEGGGIHGAPGDLGLSGGYWWRRVSFWRFLAVGVLVTIVDFSVLTILHGFLGWDVILSVVLAYLAAFVVNFTLSRTWTFQASGAGSGGQLVRFTALVAANILATAGGMAMLTGLGLHYLMAKVLLTAVIVAVNYVVMRRWVFPRPAGPLT